MLVAFWQNSAVCRCSWRSSSLLVIFMCLRMCCSERDVKQEWEIGKLSELSELQRKETLRWLRMRVLNSGALPGSQQQQHAACSMQEPGLVQAPRTMCTKFQVPYWPRTNSNPYVSSFHLVNVCQFTVGTNRTVRPLRLPQRAVSHGAALCSSHYYRVAFHCLNFHDPTYFLTDASSSISFL